MNKKTLIPITLLSVFLCLVGCRNPQINKTVLKSAEELTKNKSAQKDISKTVLKSAEELTKNKSAQKDISKTVINKSKQTTKTINKKRNLLNDDEKKELKKELFNKTIEYTSVWKCPECGYAITIKTKTPHPIRKKCKRCKTSMTRVWNCSV